MAEANKKRLVMEAEAEAEAIKIRGEAEAFAIKAKATAEAEQMAKKAAAWNEYKSAAMIDMMLDTLPKVIKKNLDFNFFFYLNVFYIIFFFLSYLFRLQLKLQHLCHKQRK